MRTAKVERKTNETSIALELNIDGQGLYEGKSGIPFMDHMLDLWCCHGGCDLKLEAKGDLEIDGHHTMEDLGICFGKCINDALGSKSGINRYGAAWIPMDEALSNVILDISGRPFLYYEVPVQTEKIGTFEVELVEEFFRAVCLHGGLTLHIQLQRGKNGHHIIESVFKAFARAFREATAITGEGIPSTKGSI